MKEIGHSGSSEVLVQEELTFRLLETHVRDLMILEGRSRESFLEEVMSELRLTRKKSGSG